MWVLNPAGLAGRGIVEVIGDPKTNRWTTPSIDHEKHFAISVNKSYVGQFNTVVTEVAYNGDNCNESGELCLALFYFKSTRGDMDLSAYDKLIFDIEILEDPSEELLLRIGSYPTRAEFDIRDMLPKAGEGWKKVVVTRAKLEQHFFEDFSFERVADPFSLTTAGTVKYRVKNIKWSLP